MYYNSTEESWKCIVIGSYNAPLTRATIHYAEATGRVINSGECGTDGDNLTWTMYDTGVLSISGEGAMKNYSTDSNVPWKNYRTAIETVELPEGLTTVGNYAFYNCTSLSSVEIPNGVTSIGSYTFSGCSGLTSVEIPASVKTINSYAFSGCSKLSSVAIPSSVTSIGDYAFYRCSKLSSVEIPNGVILFFILRIMVAYYSLRFMVYRNTTDIPNYILSYVREQNRHIFKKRLQKRQSSAFPMGLYPICPPLM